MAQPDRGSDAASVLVEGRYPATIVFEAKSRWPLVLVIICVVGVIGGVLLGSAGIVVGWVSVACWAFGIVLFGLQLLRPGTLVVSPDGLQTTMFGRTWTASWSDLADFGCRDTSLLGLRISSLVTYRRHGDPRQPTGPTDRPGRPSDTGDGALPSSYGVAAPELAAFLTTYRAAALAADGPPGG